MTDNLPALAPTGLEALAQAHEREAFGLLVEIVRDPQAKAEARIKAAESILDRARGRARQQVARDPTTRRQKAVSMSTDALLKLLEKAQKRTAHQDAVRVQAKILEGEFVPATRKLPRNEFAEPVVPGTKEVDELLS